MPSLQSTYEGAYAGERPQEAYTAVPEQPAPHTAGPHKHDLANKLDPRVNSKPTGAKAAEIKAQKDPRDAAQAPPSLVAEHVGKEVHHDDHTHDRERRHSVATAQETFSGV